MLRWVFVITAITLGACASTHLCVERGGQWYASAVDPRLPGSCVMPAVDSGNPCTEHDHCGAGYCACSDERRADGRPIPEGGAMTGVCPSFPLRAQDGMVCTVEGGSKHEQGLRIE
jgi:hypothetical protein